MTLKHKIWFLFDNLSYNLQEYELKFLLIMLWSLFF